MNKQDQEVLNFGNDEKMTDEDKVKECVRMLEEEGEEDITHEETINEIASMSNRHSQLRERRFSNETEIWLGRDIPTDWEELPADFEGQYGGEPPEEIKQFYEMCGEAAGSINPDTAKVACVSGYTMDPYGLRYWLPGQLRQTQRIYLVWNAEMDVWVAEEDVPCSILDKLKGKRLGE
jgi:hypothetical protein